MRCQCIICQELFENNDEQVISALDCGHTFHCVCLNQWLENGNTCPSCRAPVHQKKIIHRLYFDSPEDADDVLDDAKLQNDIDALKLEVRKIKKEKNDIAKDREFQSQQVIELRITKDQIEQLLKEEQTKNSIHLKNLRSYESQLKSIEQDRVEYRKVKQKLEELQSLEILLNGVESDAAYIIASTGEKSGALQSLSRQLAFLKREFEKLKLEKRQMKEQYDKMQLGEHTRSKQIRDLTKERQSLKDQLERSEGDLKLAEKEIGLLQKKNTKLREKLKRLLSSPTSTAASSSFSNLMDESMKMKVFSSSTPKLSNHGNIIELDLTPDLFASPSLISPSDNGNLQTISCTKSSNNFKNAKKSTKRAADNDENQDTTKYLKITSAVGKKKRFNSNLAVNNTNSIATLAAMNIFKKRELTGRDGNQDSISRKGFDGLGGHTTFINPLGNPFKKPATKKKSLSKSGKPPPLPSLDNFVIID